ncbi:hypothetical protein C8Q78DRAFT_683976 [Trametes maxima]|nr:hypothetical protein C8Q78DRAFT_683976 [Trametes maxima]
MTSNVLWSLQMVFHNRTVCLAIRSLLLPSFGAHTPYTSTTYQPYVYNLFFNRVVRCDRVSYPYRPPRRCAAQLMNGAVYALPRHSDHALGHLGRASVWSPHRPVRPSSPSTRRRDRIRV